MSECNKLKHSKEVNENYLRLLEDQLRKETNIDQKKGIEFKILIRKDKISKIDKQIKDC